MNIEQTISHYLDGELSSEQEAEFHHLLSVSPEARSLFREHMKLQSIARDEQILFSPEAELRNSLFSRLQAEGMSTSALTGGVAAAMVDVEPPVESPFRGTSEQVRHRRNPTPMFVAADRAPMQNQERVEEKRRRRLIPILLPTLLLAVAGSILWFDWRNGDIDGADRTIATADIRGMDEGALGERATEQGLIDRGVTRSAPADDAPGQVDANGSTDQGVRSSRQVPAEATPPPAAQRAAVSSRPREENMLSVQQEEVSTRDSDVLNPADSYIAHSIPPDENIGGLSNLERVGAPVNSSLSVGMGDDSNRGDVQDALADLANSDIREFGESQPSLSISAPEIPIRAVRDRMNTSAAEQVAESVHADVSSSTLPDPTFELAMDVEASRNDGGSVVISGRDEDGNPIVPLLENRDEILETLRDLGVFIGHDGTFSITPPAEEDPVALNVPSSILFSPDDNSSPVVVYHATADQDLAEDRLEAEVSDVPISSDAIASSESFDQSPASKVALERESGFRPFIAIEGSLSGPVSNSIRSISWVQDDPVTQTSSIKGEILFKGGSRGLLLVAGLTQYEERSVTYNKVARGPEPLITENVVQDQQEFWLGMGGRYIVRLNGKLATGLEGVIGAGEKRFHAGISVPVSWSLSEKFAIEFIPHVRYRNAHAPLRPTTGTSPGYETIKGPSNDEELSVGTGIGLILLLY